MRIVEKKCPKCGATLDFNVGERDVKCKSCRHKFAVEYDGIPDVSKLAEEALDAINDVSIDLFPIRKIAIVIFIIAFVFIGIIGGVSFLLIMNNHNRHLDEFNRTQEEIRRSNQQVLENIQNNAAY